MSDKTRKPVAHAIGAAIAGSMLLGGAASAGENPFGLSELDRGYMQLASAHMEGKCGAGKCGSNMPAEAADAAKADAMQGKCGAGKCGSNMPSEATGDMKADSMEGKCGAGKCGSNMATEGADAAKADAMQGKCGAGKCGSAK